jgi:hypothetical protein
MKRDNVMSLGARSAVFRGCSSVGATKRYRFSFEGRGAGLILATQITSLQSKCTHMACNSLSCSSFPVPRLRRPLNMFAYCILAITRSRVHHQHGH